ncbi:MAG: DUF167 domain-containing protein [Desulfosarcinaceae bacterium]
MIKIDQSAQTLTFSVYVQPRASSCAIVGRHQDALKIKLTAPPVGGAANKQCLAVLAKSLDVPKSEIEIISGQTNRRKVFRIQAGRKSLAEIKNRLRQLAGPPEVDNQ